jgi:4,5-DOPA dioxygenase extradiol
MSRANGAGIAMTNTLPTLFLSHGAPTLALQDTPTTRSWHALASALHAPRAVLVVSAHHNARSPTVTGSTHPETIHDFGGFPDALYQIQYPVKGDAGLSADVRDHLLAAGFADAGIDTARGIDHGVWVPLRHMYPDANVPVISLSVSPCENAGWHYRMGTALAHLRSAGVLVIGSGGLTHNLGALDWHGRPDHAAPWAQAFADWFITQLHNHDIDSLLEWRQAAPEPLRNHPTPEHLLPIFVAMGAAGSGFTTDVIEPRFDMGSLALHGLRFN